MMTTTKTMQWVLLSLLAVMTAIRVTAAGSLRSLSEQQSGPYRPSCYPEIGFDYEGYDIKNVPSTPADQCCSECAHTSGCMAWSWSDYSNGTCWLKSQRGRILVNQHVQSAMLCDGYRKTCEIAQDVDFVGNDIGNVPSANAGGCCDLCRKFLGCRAYSWSGFNGGTCWLKSSKGVAIVKKGVQSAEVYPATAYQPVCALAYDVDFAGNDIGSAPSAAPTGCCDVCMHTKGCRAFSWTTQSGGTCYLKSVSGESVPKPGVVSSVVFSNPGYTCDIEAGFDYQGSDLTSVRSAKADACCTICSDYTGCKAYTWSDLNGGTCWLKSGKGTRVANAKTVSGTPCGL